MSDSLQDIFKAASRNNVYFFWVYSVFFWKLLFVDWYIPFPRVMCFLQLQSVSGLTGLPLETPYSSEGRFSMHLTGSILS